MNLFRARVWSAVDIGLLKWCCVLFGMIVGAYCAEFTKSHVIGIALVATLLAIKPTVNYFRASKATI